MPGISSQDPDGLGCYSDHAEDIRAHGECSMCTSTEPDVVGHVLPDVERLHGLDPVEASERVIKDGMKMVDGILLDRLTAVHIVAVHDALNTEDAQAKLRAMTLLRAGEVCFRLTKKVGAS